MFKSRKKFTVSERDPTYKVKYFGNVQTSMMRGEGCVDKPTAILWNNYLKTASAGIAMNLTVCASGLKAITKEQGLTEYRAHRISYCIAHPKYPRLFVWVYRHEGKKLKVELRCHAVLCKTDAKAKAMAVQLHDKLAFALNEFMREKTRKQNARLALQRTHSLPLTSGTKGLNTRNKFLSTGQNFKPPVDRSASAPKLGSIIEDCEPEEVLEEEDEEDDDDDGLDEDYMLVMTSKRLQKTPHDVDHEDRTLEDNGVIDVSNALFKLEIGNNVDELKQDSGVQYQLDNLESDDNDDDSSESGFSEQDAKENISNGSGSFGSDSQLTKCGGNTHTSTCPMYGQHHGVSSHLHSDVTCLCDHSDTGGNECDVSTVTYSPNANGGTAGVAMETTIRDNASPELSPRRTVKCVPQNETSLHGNGCLDKTERTNNQSEHTNGQIPVPIIINQHRL